MRNPIKWSECVSRKGRNDYPAILNQVFGMLSYDEQCEALDQAWHMPEWPEQHLGTERWIGMFREVGFMDGGFAASIETNVPESIVLYRGATEKHMRGMAWTDNRAVAQWFANRFKELGPAFVYEAVVPRSAILATTKTRGEDEYIVDTSMPFAITEYGDPSEHDYQAE